jgi:cytochrome c oxidase subunit 1
MEFALPSGRSARRLTAGWLLLALCALTISTLCAVLLIVARTPWLGALAGSGELFGRALALHVSLAVVVWFLACAAAFWTIAAGTEAGFLRWSALGLSGAGLIAMVLSLFFTSATPVLANYVPVLNHPLFLAGLGLFVSGVALTGVAAVPGLTRQLGKGPVWRLGALLSIVAACAAALAFVASYAQVDTVAVAARFEQLAWGPGHVLQFVHVILLMSVWAVLGRQVLQFEMAPRLMLVALSLLAALPVVGVPIIYLTFPMDTPDFRRAFTLLMAYGSWPAAVLLALCGLWQLRREWRTTWMAPHSAALVLSMVLFLLGCVLGALIRADSTMVPAHYHGTVGAVTLAYMALAYRLLPQFGVPITVGSCVRWQPWLYGSGLLVLALALAWSGSLGVPRKTLHVDVIVQYPAYFAAMGLAGLGGLLAIAGAALFVFNIIRAVRSVAVPAKPRSARRDVRWQALVWTLGLTLVIGLFLANASDDNAGAVAARQADPLKDASGHSVQKRKEEIELRFSKGVALLNARQFDAAASELHRVLELAPQMPEAHVNMGFAMIGIQRFATARDFFNAAIDLNVQQRNAYYGLAIALAGLRDLPSALGAMRSYVHLSKGDDAYLGKANAAIKGWEAELKKPQAGAEMRAIKP